MDIQISRDTLISQQGNDPDFFSNNVLYYLDVLRSLKISYLRISKQMNFYAAIFLIWANHDRETGFNNSEGSRYFHDFLRAFQIKEEDIPIREKEGISAINQSNLPWELKNGPIDNRRVIDAFRQYKKKLTNHSIVPGPLSSPENFISIMRRSMKLHFWEETQELFMRVIPKEYKKFWTDILITWGQSILSIKANLEGDDA